MTGRPPIPLTEENLRAELAKLRHDGLWPPLIKRRLPLLSWLARQVATTDIAVIKQMDSDDDRVRHEATGAAIKQLIESAAKDVVNLGDKGIPPLFGFELPYPERASAPKRYEAAHATTFHGATYIARTLAIEWLDDLAVRMYECCASYARDDDIAHDAEATEDEGQSAPQEALAPELPAEPYSHTETPADESDEDHEAPCEILPSADAEPSSQPEPPPPERDLPAASLPHHRDRLRLWASIASAAAVAVLLILLVLPGPLKDAFGGSCGSTTALHLPITTNGSNTILYMYAPHQKEARHGWSYGIIEPSRQEPMQGGETRPFALVYHAEKGEPAMARVALPSGASLKPNSVCVYRHGDASTGQSHTAKSLLTGLAIGNVAHNDVVAVTFDATMPSLPSDISVIRFYGLIASPSTIAEPNWIENSPWVEI